jgi:hypothetical protein
VAIDERSQNPFEVSNRFARKSFLDSVVLHGTPPAKEMKNLHFVVICLILQSYSFLHSHLRFFEYHIAAST